jgi:hypothetical protein
MMQKIGLLLCILLALSVIGKAQLSYTSCPGCWNPDSLGNHRAVVRYNGTGAVAHVVVPWRRRDSDPGGKRVIVQDSATGARVLNVIGAVTRESGEFFFQPVSGAGNYYIYYLPYHNEGRSNYPKGVYWRSDTTADAKWVGDGHGRGGKGGDGRGESVVNARWSGWSLSIPSIAFIRWR